MAWLLPEAESGTVECVAVNGGPTFLDFYDGASEYCGHVIDAAWRVPTLPLTARDVGWRGFQGQ